MLKAFNEDLPLLRTICLLIAFAFVSANPAGAAQLQITPTLGLAAFALPDGSLPVICFGNGEPLSSADDHCDACLQSQSIPHAIAGPDNDFVVPVGAGGLSANRMSGFDDWRELAANPARAPPVS
ncbi:MAG: hypothetical protein GKR97_01495 [Rhizobiaceae bacterium]|nr:hypothetical protein [Rhizobiaceae bacterium]